MSRQEWLDEINKYRIDHFTFSSARACILCTLPDLGWETPLFAIHRKDDNTEQWYCNGRPADF